MRHNWTEMRTKRGGMRFIDWFAGVGGFRLGLERAGMTCVGACEIDPHARRVYEARFGRHEWFPRDITEVRSEEIPEADLWCGGSPCQGFSAAGKRGGLADARSGLLSTWLQLAAERRPRWLLVENVPDILRVHGGRDWERLLLMLDDLGSVGAWRILDARGFGVPQRRFRLFLLARLAGEGPDPGEVLALAARSSRAPAAGREPAADAAGRAAGGAGATRSVGALVRDGSRRGGRHGKDLVVGALTASDGGAELAGRLVMSALTASAGHHGHSSPRGDPGDSGGVPFTLESQASTTTKAARIAEHARALDTNGAGPTPGQGGTMVGGSGQSGPWHARETDESATLQSKGAKPTGNEAGTIIAFDPTQDPVSGEASPSLQHQARAGYGPGRVRRLTPLECEKLMALPPGHTCTCGCEPYSTAACTCPDAPRYRATGNSVVTTIPEWIGRRLITAGDG